MNVYRYIYQIQRTSIVQNDTRSGGNVFRRTQSEWNELNKINKISWAKRKGDNEKKTQNYVYTID